MQQSPGPSGPGDCCCYSDYSAQNMQFAFAGLLQKVWAGLPAGANTYFLCNIDGCYSRPDAMISSGPVSPISRAAHTYTSIFAINPAASQGIVSDFQPLPCFGFSPLPRDFLKGGKGADADGMGIRKNKLAPGIFTLYNQRSQTDRSFLPQARGEKHE